MTLYAVWTKTANKATVSFDTQGGRFDGNGTGYQPIDNSIAVGDSYAVDGKLPLASKGHYTFDGWYTQATGGDKITATSTVETADPHTLYAHYTEYTYTITFNPNGGTGNMEPMADIPYHDSNSRKLTRNVFTKSDSQGKFTFTFAGWSTTRADDNNTSAVQWKDGASVSGTDFQDGEIQWNAGKGTVTLYAVWTKTANKATVSFDPLGGSFDDNSTGYQKTGNSIAVGDPYSVGGKLPKASKDHYTFDGWYTEADGGTEITASSTVGTAEPHTLYAHYTEHTYTITFNANGGTGNMEPMAGIPYSTAKALTGNTFTRTDSQGKSSFTFAGWSTTAASDNDTSAVRWKDGASVSGADFRDGEIQWNAGKGTVTLYAVWTKTANKATVSFDPLGGSFDDNGTGYQKTGNSIAVGDPYSVGGKLPKASKDHYTFDGWYTEADGGTEITASSTVGTAEPHTLYAHYTEHTYTITFNANGGTGSMEPMADIPYSTAKALTGNTFTRTDSQGKSSFTFAGWSTTAASDNDTSAVQWKDGASVSGTDFQDGEIQWNAGKGTVTLYAVWTKEAVEQATVSFDTQGGSFDDNGTGYQKTGNSIPVGSPYGAGDSLPKAFKDHYTFDGWYTQAAGGEQVMPQTIVTEAGSHTLYAHYTDDIYTITFNANGGTGSMADMTDLPYHSSRNLTRNTFTKSDSQGKFTFAGWSTTKANDNDISAVQWEDGASVTGADFQSKNQRDASDKSTVTLYAVWKRKTPGPTPPPTPPVPPNPPTPPNPPAPPSGQEPQATWQALSNPVQTVQRVIENVKTGDSRPYWKWVILLVIGILTTLYPIFAAIYLHFRQKGRKCD